jgi:hypothetical protein
VSAVLTFAEHGIGSDPAGRRHLARRPGGRQRHRGRPRPAPEPHRRDDAKRAPCASSRACPQRAQPRLKPHNLFFTPETSTANRAMIGGMVGNNSCGANSIVHGTTRDHVRVDPRLPQRRLRGDLRPAHARSSSRNAPAPTRWRRRSTAPCVTCWAIRRTGQLIREITPSPPSRAATPATRSTN